MGGLYKCDYSAPDGAKGSRRITAKDEADARKRIKEMKPDVHIMAVTAIPATSPKPPRAVAPKASKPKSLVPAVAPPAPKAGSKLEKLLFRQDNQCFFCGRKLSKAEASIEHLQPKSAGGTNDDGNVVACCVTLNRTLGNMSLKEKFAMVLKKAGHFVCPEEPKTPSRERRLGATAPTESLGDR